MSSSASPGPGNDLTNLTARLPRLEQLTSTVFPRTIRTFDRSQDFVDTLRQYTPDLGGAVTKLGQVTNSYDANGHYARVQPMFVPFSANPSTGELTAVPPRSGAPGSRPGASAAAPAGPCRRRRTARRRSTVPGCLPASRPDG